MAVGEIVGVRNSEKDPGSYFYVYYIYDSIFARVSVDSSTVKIRLNLK